MKRVVVFVDYQNVYRRGRDAFFDHNSAHSSVGNIDPLELGELLIAKGLSGRYLKEVRVYRGMPVNGKDSRSYNAARSQIAAWKSKSKNVSVITSDIRYPYGWTDPINRTDKSLPFDGKPQEKGIDVALAVDLATMAVHNQYDVGIVFSCDTDLMPSLDFVSRRHEKNTSLAKIEVAAWAGIKKPGDKKTRRQRLGDTKVWCHWLDLDCYDAIKDEAKYAQSGYTKSPSGLYTSSTGPDKAA